MNRKLICWVVVLALLVITIPFGFMMTQPPQDAPDEEGTLIVVCNETVDVPEFTEQLNEEVNADISDGELVYNDLSGDTTMTVEATGDIDKTINELESLPQVDFVQRDIRYELLEDDVVEGDMEVNMKVISDEPTEPFDVEEESSTEESTEPSIETETDVPEEVEELVEESTIEELAKTISDVVTNDDYYSSQYWLQDWCPDYNKYGHNVSDAWNYAKGNGKVTVAVLDTGCEYTHSDLSANIDKSNMADTSENPVKIGVMSDKHGHGTHVCGLVGAVSNNSVGISGVSYNAKVLPIKVFDDDGYCYSSALHRAYMYLEDGIKSGDIKNLKVINMSLGGYTKGYYDNLLEQDIEHFYKDYGIITCCAGGNDEVSTVSYPSDFEYSLAVTRSGKTGKEEGCDYNEYKDISAAGSTCISTYLNGKYTYMSGTSMSSPVAAGIIALCWSASPSTSAEKMREAIIKTAKPLVSQKSASAGSINAVGILNYLGVIPDSDLPDGWVQSDNPSDNTPIAPDKPTVNEPTQPIETEPTETEPTQPIQPTEPTQPPTETQPTQPTNPTTPVVTQPTKPPVTTYTTYITKYKKYKKAFRVYWKKKSCDGYQIRYSRYSSMKSAKTVNVSKKYTSKKFTKLKKKTKYYVQIRTYKTYKGKKYYSSWSKVKYVKTK